VAGSFFFAAARLRGLSRAAAGLAASDSFVNPVIAMLLARSKT
jgi:hypothetical protein